MSVPAAHPLEMEALRSSSRVSSAQHTAQERRRGGDGADGPAARAEEFRGGAVRNPYVRAIEALDSVFGEPGASEAKADPGRFGASAPAPRTQMPSEGCTGGSGPAANLSGGETAEAMLEGFCRGFAVCEEVFSKRLLAAGHEGIVTTGDVLTDIADWCEAPERHKARSDEFAQMFRHAHGRASHLENFLRLRGSASAGATSSEAVAQKEDSQEQVMQAQLAHCAALLERVESEVVLRSDHLETLRADISAHAPLHLRAEVDELRGELRERDLQIEVLRADLARSRVTPAPVQPNTLSKLRLDSINGSLADLHGIAYSARTQTELHPGLLRFDNFSFEGERFQPVHPIRGAESEQQIVREPHESRILESHRSRQHLPLHASAVLRSPVARSPARVATSVSPVRRRLVAGDEAVTPTPPLRPFMWQRGVEHDHSHADMRQLSMPCIDSAGAVSPALVCAATPRTAVLPPPAVQMTPPAHGFGGPQVFAELSPWPWPPQASPKMSPMHRGRPDQMSPRRLAESSWSALQSTTDLSMVESSADPVEVRCARSSSVSAPRRGVQSPAAGGGNGPNMVKRFVSAPMPSARSSRQSPAARGWPMPVSSPMSPAGLFSARTGSSPVLGGINMPGRVAAPPPRTPSTSAPFACRTR